MVKSRLNTFSQEKILAHPEKLAAFFANDPHTLVLAEIDPTNLCNHACPKCAGGRKFAKASLSGSEMKDYIRQLKKMGTKAIYFAGGGEPLLNKHTPLAVKYAKSLDLAVALYTNAPSDISSNDMDNLLSSCTYIKFSLDAGNHKMYQRTHGVNEAMFKKTLKNIEKFVIQRNKRKFKCVLGTGYLTGKHTCTTKEMEKFVVLSKRLKIDFVHFKPFFGDKTSLTGKIKKFRQKYDAKDFKILASTQRYDRFGKKLFPYKTCWGINFFAVIGADSHIYPCCHHIGNRKYSLGNLKKSSFKRL